MSNNPFKVSQLTVIKDAKDKVDLSVLTTKGRFKLSESSYKALGSPVRVIFESNFGEIREAIKRDDKVVQEARAILQTQGGNSIEDIMLKKYGIFRLVAQKADVKAGSKVGKNLEFSNISGWKMLGKDSKKASLNFSKVENGVATIEFDKLLF